MEALLVGITLVAAIAVALVIRKKVAGRNTHYDEMQVRIQADGYRLGFFAIIAAVFVLIFLYAFDGMAERVVEPALGMFAAVMLGIVIFTVYCIRKGAFFQINENGKRYGGLLVVITILNGAIGIGRIADGTLWEGGAMRFTNGGSNLVLAVGFLVVLIVLLADHARRKNEVEE